MTSHGTTTLRDILLTIAAITAFVGLAIWQYRVVSRALERRGKPKWHAFFGVASLLEIGLNRPRDVSYRSTQAHASPARLRQETEDSEKPLAVTPNPKVVDSKHHPE